MEPYQVKFIVKAASGEILHEEITYLDKISEQPQKGDIIEEFSNYKFDYFIFVVARKINLAKRTLTILCQSRPYDYKFDQAVTFKD